MADTLPLADEDIKQLELLVRSHHPLICIESDEDAVVRGLLGAVARRLHMPYLVWTAHAGLCREGEGEGSIYKTESPGQCLAHLRGADSETIAYLPGFQVHLTAVDIQSRILELHQRLMKHRGAIVLRAVAADLPKEVSRLFTTIVLRPPSVESYHRYVNDVLAELKQRMQLEIRLTSGDVAELIAHLRGMPFYEVRKIITQAVVEDGRLDRGDLTAVLEAKRRVIQRSGTLEYISVSEGAAQIAGLSRLKIWLERRRICFLDPARAASLGLEPPRGVLLLGMQGCGKSLSARAISSMFRLPLLRLDPGSLYRKYFGESEANMRRALATAEAVAPCVLWLDEIEKALGQGGDSDGGTAQRVLGSFLTWMSEKKAPVFVLATSNDISQLPPELLRKGRFDEIFFVDLPSHEVRTHIFALHLASRRQDPSLFSLDELAQLTFGFSGAEIEQLVVSGLFAALSRDRPLDDDILRDEIEQTVPLSETMAEKLDALRAWAQSRAVPVD